jgi:hypothetical protein
MDYAQAGASSGVYLILLRAWTVSATSGAIYLVSFITGKNTAMSCIESSSLATLSVNYNTDEVTITFPTQDNQGNYPGGMVAILGGPVI